MGLGTYRGSRLLYIHTQCMPIWVPGSQVLGSPDPRSSGPLNIVSRVCVVCYHSSECYEYFKDKVSYQQKALNVGNKINIGIELKILGLKVMTVISLTAGNQVTSIVRRRLLVG